MQIALDDMNQLKLLYEIEDRKKTLRERFNEMRNSYTENTLSKEVLDDYKQYYQNIIDEKQLLLNAFNNISEYLEKSILKNCNTKEMNVLRKDLDEIFIKIYSIENEII